MINILGRAVDFAHRRSCFGDAEVNVFGDRHTVVYRNQYVRWFEFAVNDPLLVRVLHRLADLAE